MTLTTSLSEIRSHGPCQDGFDKIREHFGVSPADAKTDTTPFPVALLLETNGLLDALWVFDHVAPKVMIDRFLVRRLDTGDYSALKTLRSIGGDWSRQIEAVERVVALLHRRIAGEDVAEEMEKAAYAALAADAAAAAAADAAYAAYAARAAYAAAADAAYAAYAAARAAYAAAADAAYAADAAAHAAYAAADAASRSDLIAALNGEDK